MRARGWFRRGEPGALLDANYDPNDTALGQVLSRLPMRRGVEA